jgi:hypothetical protein
MTDPVLIQPVDSPVICKPYYEPTHYWEYDRATGCAQKRAGRRPASYWYRDPGIDIRTGQLTLELEEERRDLVLVNKLRNDVKRWRSSNWEGATNVTKDLLRHWWRKDRARRFFFCQLEAAETIIFLNEIRGLRRDGSRGKPRWTPEFTDADFETLADRPFDPEYPPLSRMCAKMATGSGKTLDSSWEQTAAFYLEQQTDHVFCYVRNDRPFLLIPYEYEGVQHHFEPDYLVRFKSGKTIVLEMKGEENDQDRAKHQAARRWITAVNAWGRLGPWEFLVCGDPHLLPRLIAGIRTG